MSKDKRVKNRNPLERTNCFNCNNCTYIAEGDHICDMDNEFVISDWEPTEHFYHCEGKDFEKI